MPAPLIALLIFAALAGGAQAAPLTIATEAAYPPWNATTADGRIVGFEIDLAHDLCRRMTAECNIIAMAWDGILPGLQQGRYDAVMAGVSITADRLRVVDFSRPYAVDPAVFAVPATSPLASAFPAGTSVDLDGDPEMARGAVTALATVLAGRTVGLQGSTSHARLMDALWPGVAVRFYETFDAAALDAAAGRVDALIGARTSIEAAGGLTAVGPAFRRGALGQGVAVAVRKGNSLVARVNAALDEATKDGTTSALSRRWFGVDISASSP